MNNSQEGVSSTGWQPNHASLDNEVYRFLVSYYLHQDKLSWSRTQALVVVEAGLLAASFAKGGLIAIISLLIGSVVIWLIWRLIQRDWEVRDQNLEIIDKVHGPKGIRMVKDARNNWWRGKFIVGFIVYIIIGLNIFFLVMFILHFVGLNTLNLEQLFGLSHPDASNIIKVAQEVKMPQNWGEWGAVASILTVILTVPTVLFLLRQIYLQRREHKRTAAALLYNYIDTAEYRRAARFIYDSKPEDLVIDKLSEDDREKVEFVANAFDRVGFMVKAKLMNEDDVYHLYGSPVLKAAQKLQLHLKDQREKRANEGGKYNPDFDYLAQRFKRRHLKENGFKVDGNIRKLPLPELLDIKKIDIPSFSKKG